jgi:hypothetical protein
VPWLDSEGKKLKTSRWAEWGVYLPEIYLGATWTFTRKPKPSSVKNHKSAVDRKEKIHEQLLELAEFGLVEWWDAKSPLHDFVQNINPFGAVEKPNGDFRILVDPSITGVNECLVHLAVNLPTVEMALQATTPNSILGKRDLSRGFYHMSEEARQYMGFYDPLDARPGRWVALPFGASQSPSIFCNMSTSAADILNKKFIMEGVKAHTLVYVDDYLVIAETHTDLVAAFRVMDEEALLLGLTFNAKKDLGTVEPLDEIEFLGVDIRARIGDLSLPVDKRQKYLTSIFQFRAKYLYEKVAPKSELEPLVGKLGFAARTFRWGYLYLQNCLDALYGGMEDRDLCPLSPEF